MKRLITITGALLFVAIIQFDAWAQAPARRQPRQEPTSNTSAAGQLEQEFLKLEQEWMVAVQKQDDQTLERIMASDFILTTSVFPGSKSTKAQFIDIAVEPRTRLGPFSFDQVVVRLIGNVAVVNAIFSQKAKVGDLILNGDYFLTDVWVKHETGWRVTSRNLMRADKEDRRTPRSQVAGNNQSPSSTEPPKKSMPPCQSGCREQFNEASKLCRVKTGEGEDESYDLDIPCMQAASAALKTCNANCRSENEANREAKRKAAQSPAANKPPSEQP